jgi:Tfp pilus assembly protein FimT
MQEQIATLQESAAQLQSQLQYTRPAALTSAVSRGSEEAIRIMEQDRLRQLSNKESEPIVAELRNVLQAIKDLKDAIKDQELETPDGAALTF